MYSLPNTGSLDYKDQRSFTKLVEQSYLKVYNLAYKLTGNKTEAEDLTQETFYRAYRRFQDFEGDKPFENWVFRILIRLFYDFIRNRGRRISAISIDKTHDSNHYQQQNSIEIADNENNPEESLLKYSVSENLEQCLMKLKSSQRMLVFLADIEEIPYKDISEMIGIPIGTVRSRLHRAHKQLRYYLSEGLAI